MRRIQSKNPVFARREPFGSAGYAPSADQLNEMYSAPSYQDPATLRGRMTLDDVVVRTAMTLGTVILVAAAAWVLVDEPSVILTVGAALVGLGLGFFISLKHVTNPAVILGYAAVEGIFVGMASKAIGMVVEAYTGTAATTLVMQAVLGTLGAAVAMLAIYKLKIIRVTPKFTKFVIGLTFGFFIAIMFNFVLSLFGVGLGLSGLGPIGLIVAVIGAALACFNLLLDFEYVNQGIAQGAPEKDAWFAAFGLTVTLVWLYIEMLRIIAALTIMNSD